MYMAFSNNTSLGYPSCSCAIAYHLFNSTGEPRLIHRILELFFFFFFNTKTKTLMLHIYKLFVRNAIFSQLFHSASNATERMVHRGTNKRFAAKGRVLLNHSLITNTVKRGCGLMSIPSVQEKSQPSKTITSIQRLILEGNTLPREDICFLLSTVTDKRLADLS